MEYHMLKMVHVTCASASVSLFVLRGAGMWYGASWTARRWTRAVPPIIDTLLLASALMLAVSTGQSPLVQPWLAAKLTAVVVYIVLGTLALKRARTHTGQRAAFLAAVATLAYIIAVAISKQPWPLLGRL
ncbi:regulator SirB [Massilia sp. FT127W]|uniref:Regulator SirB n=2 Tax=Pseudoduganella aquatica TaxID=2660641 RepID=A0A7X4KPC8_9BURK|nr:regulator SirB [Pseudoduganella aquatica]